MLRVGVVGMVAMEATAAAVAVVAAAAAVLAVLAAAAAVLAVAVSAEAGAHEGRRVQPRWQGRGGAHCSCTPSPPCTAGTGLSGRPAVLRSPARCSQRCSSCLPG